MNFKRKWLVYLSSIIIMGLIIWFFYYFRIKLGKIIRPFITALIIAYLLRPLVVRLENRKIPRMYGILLLYLLFSFFIAAVIIFIIPETITNTKELINTLPDITTGYQNILNNIVSLIKSSNWSEEIKSTMYREIYNGTEIAQGIIVSTLKSALNGMFKMVNVLFDLILALIIGYYFIKDAEVFREGSLSLIPRKWRNGFVNTGREVNSILSNFIQGQLLTALIVSTMEVIGLFIIKVKYPIILGIVGGIANIIPYFGPIIGAVPAVAVALIQSPVKALWTIIVFTIVQQIDNAFISPKIIEGRLGLHPVTTILAVLAGGEFLGITGMLVAVPIVAILKVIAKRLVEAIV